MAQKNTVKANQAKASLYVGVGGIGGKIIRKITELAKKDNLDKARFVIMDTDVNDLSRANENINITQIQTSSPRTIRDYLLQDDDARTEWFPNNMIINSKTVSEGAGQVRSISRLALNATIRTGEIKKLYEAIDDLYDKDGGDKKQTIKIAVCSTVAGGTGSGIAMIVAMLIRNYITENYPDSSAIIRGFLLMPGIMDTFGPSTSERLSLQRNGYATIKEINAFMMRPFFESIPELRRYLDLSLDVPNGAGGVDKLTCAPFDFCFLYDRTDGNVCNMSNLDQYQEYVAHSVYELFIGPMSAKAASKEDNIVKEFLDETKLSRNRFGGAGASVVCYPYEKIRDYVAYEWMEKQILGFSGDMVSEKDAKKSVGFGWLMYDKKYQQAKAEFDNRPVGTNPPVLSEMYVNAINNGTDDFTNRIKDNYIARRNAKCINVDELREIRRGSRPSDPAVEVYIRELSDKARKLYETPHKEIMENFMASKDSLATKGNFVRRYRGINAAEGIVDPEAIKKVAKSFVDSVFNGNAKMGLGIPEPYMLESLLCIDDKPMHPNAMRYMLYRLLDRLDDLTAADEPKEDAYKRSLQDICYGVADEDTGKRDVSQFQAPGNGSEKSLFDMCKTLENHGGDSHREECNGILSGYASTIYDTYCDFVDYYVYLYAKTFVKRLLEKYAKFYERFENKVAGLAKKKKALIESLRFKNGDCVYNLFSNPNHLKMFASEQKMPQGGGQDESDLYAGIYNGMKFNAQKAEIIANNPFSDEVEEDIFDVIMIDQFRKMVETSSNLDIDIVRACGMEHTVKYLCMAEENPNEEMQEELRAKAADSIAKNAHMASVIKKGRELACPSIIRKDFEEERAVNAMAFNKYMEDGDGMFLTKDYFSPDYASDSVSRYEFRFYRSIYNITPLQLQKLCSPQVDPGVIGDCIDSVDGASAGTVGTYFTAYQDYMAKIGPDNRLNPVITPHIDKRWNSLTILPELDPKGYQRVLMKRIHKAMVYGFLLKIIEKRMTSKYDPDKLVYEYIDGRNGSKTFIVSNHTKCDRLFEVLDSLYFDRYAVHSIHSTVDAKRTKEYENSTIYEDTTFAKCLEKVDRTLLLDSKDRVEMAKDKLKDMPVSLLEIPILYWNSLPRKDESEIGVMVDAIFEIFEKEIGTFVNRVDFAPLVAKNIAAQYNTLYANFCACPAVYMGDNKFTRENAPRDIMSNDTAFKIIRKKVLEKLDSLDVSDAEEFSLNDKNEKDELFI